MAFPTPNPAPISLTAYNVHTFNGHTHLTEIHQLLMDFAHMQSHVRLPAASHLPLGTLLANNNKRAAIHTPIKEEWKRLTTIKQIINLINTNDTEIKELYNESRLIHDRTWGTLTWGPPPPWAITKQQPHPIPALPNPPLANEANSFKD